MDHPDSGNLGEFAQVCLQQDVYKAIEMFPNVAAHLDGGCQECFKAVLEMGMLIIGDSN